MVNANNVFVTTLNPQGAAEYARVRPEYPEESLDALLERFPSYKPSDLKVADVGAGTGKFTRLLVARGFQTTAIEPSPAMAQQLVDQPWAGELEVITATAEQTGLPSKSVDAVTWVQCFHWLNQPAATTEAARILRDGGIASVIGNQLDVAIPWVHRLSRIMRSGDVMRADRPPNFGEQFSAVEFTEFTWEQRLTPKDIEVLARTRSSYLHSGAAGRAKMQENLRWYLYEHLDFEPESPVSLPYRTFVWTARR